MFDVTLKCREAIKEAHLANNKSAEYSKKSTLAHIEWRRAKSHFTLKLKDKFAATILKDIVMGMDEVVKYESDYLLAHAGHEFNRERVNILKKEIAHWQEEIKSIQRGE